jgi:hypothetical protein
VSSRCGGRRSDDAFDEASSRDRGCRDGAGLTSVVDGPAAASETLSPGATMGVACGRERKWLASALWGFGPPMSAMSGSSDDHSSVDSSCAFFRRAFDFGLCLSAGVRWPLPDAAAADSAGSPESW